MDKQFSEELAATFGPSLDIANSALALAANRCSDLHMPPAICFIMLREISDLNARAYIEEKQHMVDTVLSRIPPDIREQMTVVPQLDDMYEIINNMVLELIKEGCGTTMETVG